MPDGKSPSESVTSKSAKKIHVMREFFAKLVRAFLWLDVDLEFAIAGIIAAFLLIGGPPLAFFFLLHAHHYLASAISCGVWILAVIAVMRDLRRGQFGWVSLALGFVWVAATLLVLWKAET